MRPMDVGEMTSLFTDLPAGESAVVKDGSDPFDSLSRREWLSTNGIGGFASGTVSGANTRRYHALLVATLNPPLGRMTMLGKVDEMVTVNGTRFDLSTNRYQNDIVLPDGWRYITEFTADPVPTWTYRLPGDAVIVKRVYLARGKNTVYVTYTLREAPAMAMLTLSPLTCWKDYHGEMHPWPGFPVKNAQAVGGWMMQATPDSPTLRLLVRGATWTVSNWWHNNIVHDRERERGMDFLEDLFCPAVAVVSLRVGQTIALVATIEKDEPEDETLVLAEIVKRQEALLDTAAKATTPARTIDDATRDLILAADPFIIQGTGVLAADPLVIPGSGIRSTIMAGYPWFADWGRDTMISLPGLCFSTGRLEVAKDILTSYAGFVSYGMIPNRFPDQGATPEFNTVDATLWFIDACDRYIQLSGDSNFQRYIIPIVETIVAAHIAGTRYGIHVDPSDGLLYAGQFGSQLTWMDAKVGDWVVTPRQGKAVEICALWINALRIMIRWKGEKAGGAAYVDLADRASASFREKFVRADGLGLYDVLRQDGSPDAAIRPNQIIAASLPTSPLSDEETKAVLDVVDLELLTPFGLRSLSPKDSNYHGTYGGTPRSRDGAYHQGTVWAWLIGPYVDVYRRVHGADAEITSITAPLIAHLREYGVGGIAEIFDGDSPFAPNGCPWQAWSIAELLRVHLA